MRLGRPSGIVSSTPQKPQVPSTIEAAGVSATSLEIKMTAMQGEKPLSHAAPIVPIPRATVTTSAGSGLDLPIEEAQQEWRIRLLGLQELICELLIKNQRLRVALLESTSSTQTEGQVRTA
jgi:hypothetical protein